MRLIKTNTVEVKIYRTKSSMRRAIRRIGYNCDHTEAMVIPCQVYDCKEKDSDCVKAPICAELYIHEKASLPVLVHETLHASTTVLRERKKSLDLGKHINSREERLAYTQTSILQDILKHFFPKKNSTYYLDDIEWWVKGSISENKK
jgi:hypothetical protein